METQQSGTPLMRMADEVFERGLEHWWRDERPAACRLFRRALQIDPLHADAHNHLGIQALDRGRLADAEQHFRNAIEGGERGLEREGNKVPWGYIQNRPHMRGMYNLALVLRRRGDFAGSLKLHEKLIRMNPNDNQGARFLVGEEYHRIGDARRAIAAYRKGLDDPGCAFGLALVLLDSRASASEVGAALLQGFASNRYLAPMLLGERWELLEAFHGSNVAEPEWAADLVNEVRDLWARVPRSAETLRFWWRAGPVQSWRREMDELMVALKEAPVGAERSRIVERLYSLRDTDVIARVVATALAAS